MRNRAGSDIQFGSDSFLDVVANIVGILIILIVIAGIRVSQAPVSLKQLARQLAAGTHALPVDDTTATDQASEPTPLLTDLTLPEPASPTEVISPEQDLTNVVTQDDRSMGEEEDTVPPFDPAEEIEPLLPIPELAPPAELVDRVRDLESEIAALVTSKNVVNQSLATRQQQLTALEERLASVRTLLAERERQRLDVADRTEAMKFKRASQIRDLEFARQTAARLLTQVKDAEQSAAPVEMIRHRVTPIGRTVNGKEKHFRLAGNRVTEVPIDTLVERLKEQIDRRRDWLVRNHSHENQVGPVGGYSMKYLIRVEAVTGLEEIRLGHSGYRVGLAKWEIVPEPGLRGESAEDALRRGSKFSRALIETDAKTTLTFWVYPDSYAIFRQLQEHAHTHGFAVAARPLPEGIPIAGSPDGSRSSSQ